MRNRLTKQPARTIQLSSRSSYYDAASSTPLRDYGSFPSVYEDSYFCGPVRALVLGRLRREVRNNEYLAGLVAKFPEALGTSELRSRTSSIDYNEAHDLLWFRWSKSAGTEGSSLKVLESVIAAELLVAGEVFIILLANGKIQLVASEFCGSPWYGRNGGEINGITYSDRGTPTHYRFGKMNDSGMVDFSESTVIPARYVVHIWRRDRVLQGRGLPWLLPCLRPAHDLQEITIAKTKQIKDASKISGTIEKAGAASTLDDWARAPANFSDDGPGEDPDAPADPIDHSPVVIELKDGTFIGLEPGEKLNMLKSEYGATDYKELIMLMLHAISSPIGLPVELWFSGLGDVNYSGFKGLGTQWDSRRQYILSILQAGYLNRIHFWRISKARLEGELPENPDDDDDLYDLRWRRTPILDDEKDAKKSKIRLETGIDSLGDVWEADGYYAEEILMARRELYIKFLIASGQLKRDSDTSDVIVPLSFLMRNELPAAPEKPDLEEPTEE